MQEKIKPFLKWAGGKRQLANSINEFRIDQHGEHFNRYFEPFAGAAAYFFHLQPSHATLNDINEEIINTYIVIRDNFNELIEELSIHEEMDKQKTSEYYYEIRKRDREDNYKTKYSNISRAARIIYLNKMCYNGLYRVNSAGHFNVPYDKSKKPFKADLENLSLVSNYLKNNDISIKNEDFSKILDAAKKDDLIYFDPPYFPVTETANFDKYNANGFGKSLDDKKEEQKKLKRIADTLSKRGCQVIISNSNTEFIRELYDNKVPGEESEIQYYVVQTITARRMINSVHTKRISEKNNELLITNCRGGSYGY